MQPLQLVLRGLTYYWRTNLAVVAGVATAVAVLAGALVVGDSVRGSLRDLVVHRLGHTDRVVLSSSFFREALGDEVRADEAFAAFAGVCPMIIVQAVVSDEKSGRRVSGVDVYGVDERFWQFHGVDRGGPEGRGAFVSASLASEIGADTGGTLLVRLERPSAIPIESLHGRKDNLGRSLRLTVRDVLGSSSLGDFSIRAQQGEVRAVFVSLRRLQQDLDISGRVNALLLADRSDQTAQPRAVVEAMVRRRATPEDVGMSLRVIAPLRALAVESAAGLLDRAQVDASERAAADAGLAPQPVFTYLANSLKASDRQVPYSLVAAMDLRAIAPAVPPGSTPPPIVLNDWAASDLDVKPGDSATLEYYVWEEPGRLLTRTAEFRVAAVVPIEGAAADRNLAPVYPGITEANSLADWDPPFPIDLGKVRRVDEEYWETYKTTPKAFIPFEVGQKLWRSRYGDRTSIRFVSPAGEAPAAAGERYLARLRDKVDPMAMGLMVRDVRAEGLAASRGATDFGEYFTYFSFFLVVSALLLAALFFRLGIEQRVREIGLLRSVGFTPMAVRRVFLSEGLALAVVGAVIGIGGAVAYGHLMALGLRTWWSGAVGTKALTLHLAPLSLAIGALAVLCAATACIWWTLTGLTRMSERSLLAGNVAGDDRVSGGSQRARRWASWGGSASALVSGVLVVASATGLLGPSAGFFGAGASLLLASLGFIAVQLRREPRHLLAGHGWWAAGRLGFRNATNRPGRSVLAIAVVASAVFILISVDAFRLEGDVSSDRHSGVGGYPLLVDLLLPLVHDPNGPEGRELLGLRSADEATVEPFRVLPGDDTSCLNLYEPTNPRILGARAAFIASGRFAFQSSLASKEPERANPWLLLNREDDDAIPVIADANSMTYVLHKKLGETMTLRRGDRLVRLRLVAALDDSIFQRELLMSESNFLRVFPEEEGYRFLLIDVRGGAAASLQIAKSIEAAAADLGADTVATSDRLAEFHTVQNTYISTFQALGGLGLLVGTIGLAAVVLRNVLERRQQLALLGAVGYARAHVLAIVVGENLLLLGCGLAVGVVCAVIAIAPAAFERGGRLPIGAGGGLLLIAVLAAGLLSSIVATRAALHTRLLDALRTE